MITIKSKDDDRKDKYGMVFAKDNLHGIVSLNSPRRVLKIQTAFSLSRELLRAVKGQCEQEGTPAMSTQSSEISNRARFHTATVKRDVCAMSNVEIASIWV